jgi:hypothetical protein
MTHDPHGGSNFGSRSFSEAIEDMSMELDEFEEFEEFPGPPDRDDEIIAELAWLHEMVETMTMNGDDDGARSTADAIEATLLSSYPWLADLPGPSPVPPSTVTPS